MALVPVCTDADVAAALVRRGATVVLCRAEPAGLGELADAQRNGPAGAGRVAALIGDLADPDVASAASAMAQELFAGEAVVVSTLAQATQFPVEPPGPRATGSGTV